MTLRRSAPHGPARWFLLVASVAGAILLIATAALANIGASTFDAGDGNLVLNDETKDWENVGINCTSTPKVGCGLDLPTGRNDDSFGQGTKEDTAVPSIVSGSIPNNKSDLTRFYIANERIGDDEYVYMAWERVQEPNGTTNMDFEFNRRQCTPGTGDPDCSANGTTPIRTAGDVLIKYDLSQGGVNPTLGFHRWVTTGTPAVVCEASNTVPCWGPVQALTGNFEGAINTVVVTDPINPDAPRSLSVRTFGEAAVNLTDSGIIPPGTCEAFGSAYLKSRSSDSFTSAVKDFIAPIPVNIANCGTIIIRKETNPDGAAGSFSFTHDVGSDSDPVITSPFSLSDGGMQTILKVQSGSYTVTEGDPTPTFDLTNIDCSATTGTGTSATPNIPSRNVSITLTAGGTADCTFTNTQRGTIIVEKQTDPDGAAGSFTYTGDASGSIGDGGQITVSNLVPGTYTSTENDPTPTFDLVSITCNDSNSSGSTVTRTATFNLQAGETVKCTFTNRQRATVIIRKQTDPDGTAGTFDFDTTNGLDASEDGTAEFSLSDDGVKTYSNVVLGSYSAAERDPAPGFNLTALTCSASGIGSSATTNLTTRTASITVGAGGTVDCTFTNTQRHVVIVLVCHLGTDTLAPSDVTLGSNTEESLSAADLGSGDPTEAQLCALGGARFEGLGHGNVTPTINVGSDAHPI